MTPDPGGMNFAILVEGYNAFSFSPTCVEVEKEIFNNLAFFVYLNPPVAPRGSWTMIFTILIPLTKELFHTNYASNWPYMFFFQKKLQM